MGLRELDFDLNEEQIALRDAARKFLAEVWRPASIQLDRLADPQDVIAANSILWDVFRRTWKLGYHKMPFPKLVGGLEMDPISLALISEEMGYAAPDLAVSLAVCSTPYIYAQLSAAPEIRDLTARFCEDTEAKMTGCWAITEPDHGSDWILSAGGQGSNERIVPQVRAVSDGDAYVINGQKSSWVSNGSFASHAALWLCLDPSKGMEGCGIAVLPLDLPGISRGKPLNKIGQRALNQGEIFFENVRIPQTWVVAKDPLMYRFLSKAHLSLANGLMGLCFTGTARAALEEAINYSRIRVQGGKPICCHQNVKAKIFDMFVSVEAARSLARRASSYNSRRLKTLQSPAVHYAIAAKTLATETAFRVASQAVQIHGGYGLCKDYYVEKIFRDARASMIEDGSNDVLALEGADELIFPKP